MAGVLRRVVDRGIPVHILRPVQLERLSGVGSAEVVLVDQFEELFQLDAGLVDRLARSLGAHVSAGGTVLVTVRSDFLDRCLAQRDLAPLFSDRVVPVLPMSREQLREVIERPAQRAGLRVESGLAELVLRDAADHPAALPLLSHALAETWIRREAGVLTVDGYVAAGGLTGAVANSAEGLYQSWDAAARASCRALMPRLIDVGADGSTVRRVAPLRSLQSDPVRSAVISALVAARLLTIDQDAVAISHETLVGAWPRLADWLIEDAEDARMLAVISTATAVWEADGRATEDLLHGARLQAAIEWQASAVPDLTTEEREFLDASRVRAEAASRKIQDRAAKDRRQNRRLRWAVAGAGLLLIAAVVAGGLAAVRGGEAQAAAEDARIEALVATSLSLLDNDRDVAALLAAEAYRRWPDEPRVRSALWGVMTTTGGLIDTHHLDDEHTSSMAAIPGTDTALLVRTSADSSAVEIVDVATGEIRRSLDIPLPSDVPGSLHSIAVSPDGSTAVIQSAFAADPAAPDECCWSHLTFVDLSTGRPTTGTGLVPAVTSTHFVFDETARTVYAAHPVEGEIIAVDTVTGDVATSSPAVFADRTSPLDSDPGLALVDAGAVAVGAGDSLRIYDGSTLALLRTVPLPGDLASLDLIADGDGGLVTTGWEGTARIRLDTGEILWRRFLDPTRSCVSLYRTPGSGIACGSFEGIALLDPATGETTRTQVKLGFNTPPRFGAIDDGSLLVTVDTYPVWMRWAIDGAGAGSDVAARGRELVDGPETGSSLVVTQPVEGGRMRLWDLDRDVAVGEEADRIVPLGSGVYARYDGGTPMLENAAGDERTALSVPGAPASVDVLRGSWGDVAFAVWPEGIAPFDPSTGRARGSVIVPPEGAFSDVRSVSETPDGSRAVITWSDGAGGDTETAVFDMASGAIVVRGLRGPERTLTVSDEDLVGITGDYARRYDLATLEAVSVLARAPGGSQFMSVTSDGRTLLNVGFNNVLTLYDLTAGIGLSPSIDSDMPARHLRGGYLAPGGDRLIEALPEGIRAWELRASVQAEKVCALAGRELTEAEWATYFPGEEQVATCAELGS